MVRKNTLKITKVLTLIAPLVLASSGMAAYATTVDCSTAQSCSDDANFQVNVNEILTVRITTPDVWAQGESSVDGTFLRNTIGLSVDSNNEAGFTASMTTKTSNNALVNQAYSSATIPSLGTTGDTNCATASYQRSAFPANCWGYSLNDSTEGLTTSTYNAIAYSGQTPNTILNTSAAGSASQDIYFGAKANTDKVSGTYSNTVVISVVGGIVNNNSDDPGYNPVTPVNPDVDNPTPTDNPVYVPDTDNPTDTTLGYTHYTATSNGGTTTTTTTMIAQGEVSDLDDLYAAPQGVRRTTTASTSTTENIEEGTPLATILAATAATAALAGTGLFIVVKNRRRKDEEEEEF